MTKTRTSSVAAIVPRVFLAGVALLLVSAALYGFFLSQMISHLVAYKATESQMTALAGEMADLESQYTTFTHEVTLERAASLGLVQTAAVSFQQNVSTRGLTLRGNGI